MPKSQIILPNAVYTPLLSIVENVLDSTYHIVFHCNAVRKRKPNNNLGSVLLRNFLTYLLVNFIYSTYRHYLTCQIE